MIDSFSIVVKNSFTIKNLIAINCSPKSFLTDSFLILNKKDCFLTINTNNISSSIYNNAIFSSLITGPTPTVSLRIPASCVSFIQSNPNVNITCSLKGLLQEFFSITTNIVHVISSAVIKRKTFLYWRYLKRLKFKIEEKQNRLNVCRFCLFRL